MCVRFSLTSDIEELERRFAIRDAVRIPTMRYNIAPTQNVPVIRNNRHGVRIMDDARWGLFPFWAKDAVNADVSLLESKPCFKQMLISGRCIIPCSGMYGWQRGAEENGPKQPRAMRIMVQGQSLFAMAGLYDEWRTPEGALMRAATIVTVSASGPLSLLQERMPIVLDEEGLEDWLNPSIREFSFLRRHLQPLEPFQLRAYPVSNAVDDELYEAADCIAEIRMA